jgi:nucleoside transporter
LEICVRRRLAVMMFLQYAVLGVWGVTLPTFLMAPPYEGGLALSAQQVGLLFATFAIAAMSTPFVVGLLADRFFASQRLFAALHLLCATATLACFVFAVRQRDELHYQLTKTVMDEEQFGDLWRQIWEREDVALFLQYPDAYDRGIVKNRNYVEDILARLGLLAHASISQRHPNVWKTTTYAKLRLAGLDQSIDIAISDVMATRDLHRLVNRGWEILFALMLFLAFCYMPTITLSNAVSLRNLRHPARQYGQVRVFGTLGWMAAGIFVGVCTSPKSALPLLWGSWVALVLGLYAFSLPYTPPAHEGKTIGELFGVPAIKMFGRRGFRAFVITSFVITLVTTFHNTYLNRYLVDLGVPNAAAWQTTGQLTEIICILAIPWMRFRIGLKHTLLIGLAASVARFALYTLGNVPWMIAVGIPFQGVCYGFYFIAAMLFIDKHAPRDLRASAQGLLAICTSGVGAFAGNWVAGVAVDGYRTPAGVAWPAVWALPTIGSLAAMLYFAWQFREPVPEIEPALVPA